MRQKLTQGTAAEHERIPLSQLLAYGSGGIIPIALFNVVGVLVGLMGNISLGLSALWLGVILIIPRVWDAVADPVVGHLSDNTRTRWGRRRPFLLTGSLLVALFFVVIWWIPKNEAVVAWFPTEASYRWFQLGYILVTLTLFFTSVTVFEIPHGALGMEMTTDPHERTRLFSAKSFVGNLFAMSTPWLLVLANMEYFKGARGNEADGMRYVSMLVAALLVPLSFWWFHSLKEPGFSRAATQKPTPFWPNMKRTVGNPNFRMLTLTTFTLSMGFNFVQLLGSYIPIYYVFAGDKTGGAVVLGINGTVWAVTGLLAVFPLDWISPKLGKRNTLLLAVGMITLGQLSKIFCYNPAYPYLTAVPTVPLSCGMLFFYTLGSSMMGDIVDEDELASGTRTEGAFYAVYWWFIKTGSALASLISGALIVLTLFDETQVTKVDALQGAVRDLGTVVDELSGKQPDSSIEAEKDQLTAAGSQPQAPEKSLGPKLESARARGQELQRYLQDQSKTAKEGKDHYAALSHEGAEIDGMLARMDGTESAQALHAQLEQLKRPLARLSRQSPYTLLSMRIIEIGLPLLACLLSLVFTLRYALTEERSREIRDLLKQRHAESSAVATATHQEGPAS